MVLRAENVSKTFGQTRALNSVSIELEEGKVHALVGENGAGKSTLFKILSGYVVKDEGSIVYGDKEIDPAKLLMERNTDIGLVHQELNVNTSIGIAENIFFNQMRRFANSFGLIKKKELQHQAQLLLDDIEADIDVKKDIKSLDLGQLKVIQVAQALALNPKVLFLDESTAYLSVTEIKSLLKVVDTLKARGIALGYVSHHLDEIEMVADTLTILKDGNLVTTCKAADISRKEIESLMVGREQTYEFTQAGIDYSNKKPILELNSVTIPRLLQNVSLTLREGEILGIGGLKGAGGEAILNTIIGELKPSEGELVLYGNDYTPKGVFSANEVGIGYLPGNRQSEGLITDFSIIDNMLMSEIPRNSIFVDTKKGRSIAEHFKEYLSLRAGSLKDPCNSLSGGNMQKVVFAKCLVPNPKILLLNNPTRGIDVATRFDIYKKIHDLSKKEGLSVILLSEDLVELMGMSDRMLIFKNGKITKEFGYDEQPSEKEIIAYMT
ncbi:MAG: sugar ABC transporter ATP-binding protein [Sphaerochaetaceae bacterium]